MKNNWFTFLKMTELFFPPPSSFLPSPDKPMQMNHALFMLNGRSGYVLQPPIMRDDNFDRHTLGGLESVILQIVCGCLVGVKVFKLFVLSQVLGAHHLPKHGPGNRPDIYNTTDSTNQFLFISR